LDIACGVEDMHKLNVVHGNLKMVCHFFPPHFGHALTFVQTNILVDASRRARVAGLGVAFHRSPMPGVEIDRSFYGAAPELVNPQRFGLADGGATKESDVYAFGVLAWEVSPMLECLVGDLLNPARLSLGFRRPGSIPQREQGCRSLLDGERTSTTSS
jgi:serine/threonine protein kinase